MADGNSDNINRRQFNKLALGTATGATVGLAGCSGDGGDGGSGGDGGDGYEFALWAGITKEEEIQSVEEAILTKIEEFDEVSAASFTSYSNEDLRQNYITGAREGTPDALDGVLEHLVEYREGDLVAPVGDVVKDMDHYEGFIDSAIEALTVGDELYGLPYVGNGRALIYREDVVEELGYDGPPETWSEMLEMSREMSAESDIVEWGTHYTTQSESVRGFQEWVSHYFQLEDSMFTEEGDGWSVVPDPGTLARVYEIYAGLFEGDPSPMNPEQRGSVSDVHDDGYATGDYGMIAIGPWIQPTLEDEVYNNTQTTTLPEPEEGGPGTYLEVKPVMANAHSQNPEVAKRAVGAWANPDSMKEFMDMTGQVQPGLVHEDLEADFEDRFSEFTTAFEQGVGLDYVPWGDPTAAISQQTQEVIYGNKDPSTAGEDLHSELTEIAEGF